MGGIHRASLYAFHPWGFSPLLDPLFRVLLCMSHIPPRLIPPSHPLLSQPTKQKKTNKTQIQVYATDRLGLSARAGVNLVIVINALGIPIRAPCGYLADRYLGPLNCLIPWVSICGVLMFCWAGVHNVAGLYIFAVFYGLASAAAMGLFAGTVPSLTKDLDKIGTRVGMALAMISFGPLTGPSVAGALIAQSEHDSYLPAQLWAGAALMVGALALVGARIVITGPHLLIKV